MRILTITALALAAAAGSATAFAADGRLSDSQFVRVARCQGLAAGGDTATFDAVYKAQKRGRADFVVDRADTARSEAARLVRTDAAAAAAALASDCNQFGV